MPKKIYTTLLFTIIASLTLGMGLSAGPALGADAARSSTYPGGGGQGVMMMQQALPPDYVCSGGESVLLIQDVDPWDGASGETLSANITELLAQKIEFCKITSDKIGTTNLNQFSWILISSDQTQTFYNNLFPSGAVHPGLEAYVQAGGTLSANLTDYGWNGGIWETYTFIGGLKHVILASQNNDIANLSRPHPIVTDGLPCPSENCGLNVDAGTENDLDGWNFSSHGYFINLPEDTMEILVTPTEGGPAPVMIEYPFGAGKVIASLTTSEWRYVGATGTANKKLLANEIAYQNAIARPACLDQRVGATASYLCVSIADIEVGTLYALIPRGPDGCQVPEAEVRYFLNDPLCSAEAPCLGENGEPTDNIPDGCRYNAPEKGCGDPDDPQDDDPGLCWEEPAPNEIGCTEINARCPECMDVNIGSPTCTNYTTSSGVKIKTCFLADGTACPWRKCCKLRKTAAVCGY